MTKKLSNEFKALGFAGLTFGFVIGLIFGVTFANWNLKGIRDTNKKYIYGNLERGDSKLMSIDWREFNGGQRVYKITWVE